MKLYILVIDTPNFNRTVPINMYNFEIYLENGTQLKDLSSLYDSKIVVSSNIKNLDIINYEKAKEFNELGYDIYNKSNSFYTDNCAPASENGNDITLDDRMKNYYPSDATLCNEGCEYSNANFESQRIVCECSINANYSNSNEEENEEEIDESYLHYFLSFINYKIILCYNLFFEFTSFYYNAGFYISFTTLIVSSILMSIFWTDGIRKIKLLFFKNIPTKEKLKELYKKQNENQSNNLKDNNKKKRINHKMDTKKTKLNPPKKGDYLYKEEIREFKIDSNNDNNNNNNNNEEKKQNKIRSLYQEEVREIIIESNNNEEKKETKNDSNNNEEQKEIKNDLKKEEDFNKIRKDKKNNTTKNAEITRKESDLNVKPKMENIKSIISEKKKKKDRKWTKHYSSKKTTSKRLHYSNILNKLDDYSNELNFSNSQSKREIYNINITSNSNQIKQKLETEFEIDLNFDHLIISRNDREIEKNEINNVPFRQALRIDNRSFFEIIISVVIKEIEILGLYFYRSPYSHYSLTISIYLLESLLDLTLNFLLYSDDVVSEKYNNNGEISMLTSLTLSLISNIVSSIMVFMISKLANYTEIMESILKEVKYKKKYLRSIFRFIKYIKIKLGAFFFFELILTVLMTYYLFIFCTVYHNSQGSIIANYFYGIGISLATSFGLTLIISLMRFLGIKYRNIRLYNFSKYLFDHF